MKSMSKDVEKPISEMTVEECMDKMVFRRFKLLLQKARKKQAEATESVALVYSALEDMCIDAVRIKTDAENADNLKEAISCFIYYGEYNVGGIMREVIGAYGENEDNER